MEEIQQMTVRVDQTNIQIRLEIVRTVVSLIIVLSVLTKPLAQLVTTIQLL